MINEIDIKPNCNKYQFIIKIRHKDERNVANTVDLFASKFYADFDTAASLAREYADAAKFFGSRFEYIAADGGVYMQNPRSGALVLVHSTAGGGGTSNGFIAKKSTINEQILYSLMALYNNTQD